MSNVTRYTFILDLLVAVGCVGYGLYTDNPWIWGGGLLGIPFAFGSKKLIAHLKAKVLRKKQAATLTPERVAVSAKDSSPASVELAPVGLSTPPDVLPVVADRPINVNLFPATTPKDGRLRYY